MPTIEVYGSMDGKLLFEALVDFLPRVGETISKDMGGYFNYYDVVEIWHRELGQTGSFRACIRVELDD